MTTTSPPFFIAFCGDANDTHRQELVNLLHATHTTVDIEFVHDQASALKLCDENPGQSVLIARCLGGDLGAGTIVPRARQLSHPPPCVVFSHTAVMRPRTLRKKLLQIGAALVTDIPVECVSFVGDAVRHAHSSTSPGLSCPYTTCRVGGFPSDDSLVRHILRHHADQPNNHAPELECPLCRAQIERALNVHVFEKHADHLYPHPPSTLRFGHIPDCHKSRQFFGIIICVRSDGRFLMVNEHACAGWWLPGGAVDSGETFFEAALRECDEEAGVRVKLDAVLNIESKGLVFHPRRIILLASPIDDKAVPKQIPDFESLGAKWRSLSEIESSTKELRSHYELDYLRFVDRARREALVNGSRLVGSPGVVPISLFLSPEMMALATRDCRVAAEPAPETTV